MWDGNANEENRPGSRDELHCLSKLGRRMSSRRVQAHEGGRRFHLDIPGG